MLDIIQSIAIIAIGAVVAVKELPQIRPVKNKQKAALLDSCSLIDGRVVELAKAGFVPYDLVVPEFIVAELQLLADGSDAHKRERARFGLEVVQQLQREPDISVRIDRTKVGGKNADEKLILLAKKTGADLFTNDFNLNQVASIEGVRVLNINELTHALRPVALPGEGFEVKIVQAGSNRDQGVGYMEDGTMIVVDGARKDIGKTVSVRITRTHQTVAGKMLFAAKHVQSQAVPTEHKPAPPKRAAKPVSALRPRNPQKPNRDRPQPTGGASRHNRASTTRNRNSAATREASLLSAIDEMADK